MPPKAHRPAELAWQVFRGSDAIRRRLLTRHQLRGASWLRLRHDVYADARLERDHQLACRAALLRLPPGALIAGPSAAYLHGVHHAADFDDDVHVLVPRSVRVDSQPGLRVHHVGPGLALAPPSSAPLDQPLPALGDPPGDSPDTTPSRRLLVPSDTAPATRLLVPAGVGQALRPSASATAGSAAGPPASATRGPATRPPANATTGPTIRTFTSATALPVTGPPAYATAGSASRVFDSTGSHLAGRPRARVGTPTVTSRDARPHAADGHQPALLRTDPAECAWETAVWADPVRAVGIVDTLLASRLTSRAALTEMAARNAGRPGGRRAGWVFGLTDPAAQSPPESHLRVRLVLAGLPRPVVQYPVRLASGVVLHPDLAWPELRVAVEYDGHWHSDPDQLHRDRQRLNELVGAGWLVLHVTSRRLYRDFPAVAREVRAALGARGWRP